MKKSKTSYQKKQPATKPIVKNDAVYDNFGRKLFDIGDGDAPKLLIPAGRRRKQL